MAKPDFITDLRFYDKTSDKGPAAKGSFTIADAIFVRFVLWAQDNGGFRLALPSEPNPKFDSNRPASKENPRSFDQVGPVSPEVREELLNYIVSQMPGQTAAPAQAGGKKPAQGVKVSAPKQKDSNIPF
jgi:hypothetical protein